MYSELNSVLDEARLLRRTGRIRRLVGIMIESDGPPAQTGEVCLIRSRGAETPAEIVGFEEGRMLMMPLGPTDHIAPGDEVIATGRALEAAVGEALLGRVVDALGRPIEGPPIAGATPVSVHRSPPAPLERARIREQLPLGIRAIDGLLAVGRGQRVGIIAGAGVGKSVLLGMIARNALADVNVIGLVGERGREVREFIEQDLGPDGLARSVVVVATSDQPPLLRLRAAHTATAIAEYFRDHGRNVLLMLDSLTRVAWAQRDIGLASGEPPTRNGYTPSVFTMLPQLLERAGNDHWGSITGLYTVLVEADELGDPVGDAARSILDGHIVLSRQLAEKGHYPAIDVLASVSRLMPQIVESGHLAAAADARSILSTYRDVEDMVNLGAYSAGASGVIDRAIRLREPLMAYLRQDAEARTDIAETISRLLALTAEPAHELPLAA